MDTSGDVCRVLTPTPTRQGAERQRPAAFASSRRARSRFPDSPSLPSAPRYSRLHDVDDEARAHGNSVQVLHVLDTAYDVHYNTPVFKENLLDFCHTCWSRNGSPRGQGTGGWSASARLSEHTLYSAACALAIRSA